MGGEAGIFVCAVNFPLDVSGPWTGGEGRVAGWFAGMGGKEEAEAEGESKGRERRTVN